MIHPKYIRKSKFILFAGENLNCTFIILLKKTFLCGKPDRLPLKINDAEHPECLNCGASNPDAFCPVCGQKRIPRNHDVWALVKEFLGTYLSFDSKFSRTLIPVLFKPGFLTNEYRFGKRASYIPPIRLFVFVSIVFFLLVAILPDTSQISFGETPGENAALLSQDSTQAATIDPDDAGIEIDATREVGDTLYIFGESYPLFDTYEEYLAYREGLINKPNFVVDLVMQQAHKLEGEDPDELNKNLKKNFIELLPKLVFLVMPFFALILKLLYLRRRFFYEEHFIFALHFHTFIYLSLLPLLMLSYVWDLATLIFPILAISYLFIAMRRVYAQKFWKTFLKLILTMGAYTIVLFFALLISAFYTALSY